jgi:tetratricopeptide (TPR) repeat protein
MTTIGPARRAALWTLAAAFLALTALAGEKIPITTSSEEARRAYLQGRDLFEKLRGADARPLFEQAAAKDPSFALAQVGLANTAPTAKDFFASLERAVALADKASPSERLVICSLEAGAKGDVARQKDCLTKLVAAHPDDERAHNLMGAYYFGRQEWEQGVAEYVKATSINPQFSQPYNQMGYAYRFLGKYPDAERAFKKYIELIPSDPNPYDSYAELLMKMGRFEDSIQNYEKALTLDRNFVASYIGIGNNRVFMGQPEEARKALARLAAVARNDGERRQALFWTAMSEVHQGATDQALADVKKMAAIAEAQKDLAALSGDQNLMGDILLEAGRVDEAAAKYQEQIASIDKASVPAEVKEATRRQNLFDEARVALAKKDLSGAKAKAAAYATAVAAKKIPFEMRQQRELAGRIALEEKQYAAAVAELQQANQQDPRVLYLLAVAYQGQGNAPKAREVGSAAADFNALSQTYGFVRGKAKAMLTKTP